MTETTPNASTPGHFSPTAISELGTLLSGLDRLDPILALPAYPAIDAAGVPFGRFHLRARLGAGSYGNVVLADDPRLGRKIVIKVPQPAVLTDAEARERFVREARAAAVLDHPGIVPVYEAGEVGGLPYIAAGFVDGPTLAARLAAQTDPLQPTEVARLLRELARSVHHAHERGVLHCDLKPANILLQTSGAGQLEPMVTDFGMARILTDDPSLTSTRQLAGTPFYMSPEQARGDRRALTARSDIYALGVIFFELLTRRPPHSGEDPHEIARRIVTEPVPCPRALNPAVPRDLRAVCLKCLSKEPQDRYASAAALADDLDRYLAGRPVEARPVSLAVRTWRWVRRQPVAAAAILFGAVVTITAVAVAINRWASEVESQAKLAIETSERMANVNRAAAAEFAVELDRLRQLRESRRAGWKPLNMEVVRRLAGTTLTESQQALLRTEAAASLVQYDLPTPRTLAPGFKTYPVAFSPDGRTLAVGSWKPVGLRDWQVRLMDPDTGAIQRVLSYPGDIRWGLRAERLNQDGTRALTFSPDGRWLVVGTRSGWLVRWDLRVPDSVPVRWRHAPESSSGPVSAREERVTHVFFNSKGELWSGNGYHAVLWDVSDGSWRELSRTVNGPDHGLQLARPSGTTHSSATKDPPLFMGTAALGPDGRMVVHAREDGRRLVFEKHGEGYPVGRLADPYTDYTDDRPIEDVLFSPDGHSVITTCESHWRLKVWDVISSQLLITHEFPSESSMRVSFRPDGCMLAVAGPDGVHVYDLPRRQVADAIASQIYPLEEASLTPDGGHLATAGIGQHGRVHLQVWENRLGNEPAKSLYSDINHPPPPHDPVHVALSPKGRSLAVQTNGALVRRAVFNDQRASSPGLAVTRGMTYSRSGSLWVLEPEQISLWDRDPRVTARSTIGLDSFAVSDHDALVGRADGSICRYSPGGELEKIAHPTRDSVTALARSGDLTLAGTSRGEVHLLRGSELRHSIRDAHNDVVTTAAFGPHGYFATGSADRSVRIWTPDGRLVLTLPQVRHVRRVFWMPDGKTLLILVHHERALRRWHLGELKKELTALGIDPALP